MDEDAACSAHWRRYSGNCRCDPRGPVADDRSTIFIVIGEGVRVPGSGDAGLAYNWTFPDSQL